MVLLKLVEWLLYQLLANSCYRAARKIKNYGCFIFRNNPSDHNILRSSSSCQQCVSADHNVITNNQCSSLEEYFCIGRRSDTTTLVVSDINGTILRKTHSLFPYFMLVAFEGGSILRAFILLLSCPFLWVLGLLGDCQQLSLRVMVFISFCGLRLKDMKNVGKAVLPKFYLENLNLEAYQVFESAGRKIVFTSVPRVMVEGFLKEYLKVDVVVGTELQTIGGRGACYFTGFLTKSGLLVKHKALKELFGEGNKPDIGLVAAGRSLHDHLFTSLCKETYVVNDKEDCSSKTCSSTTSSSMMMPRVKHSKPPPLVFHDGRLAFFPTPLATLAMFLWLPLGIILAIFRLSVGIFLPYKLALLLGCWSGIDIRFNGHVSKPAHGVDHINDHNYDQSVQKNKGVLYVCTHRTLLDPVFLSTTLGKPLTAVTYSLSKMSEFISPMRTVRLTRDRKQDGETMKKLLNEGDLVVCPEGTTCREPYLLRFSPLFAELADEIVPVAMNTHVSMFYGTTASGLKCLDPIFFLMNPCPSYHVQLLEKLPRELTCAGGKSSYKVANYIQRQLGEALGFECTTLTRKDKYMMLAGNEGVVAVSGAAQKLKQLNKK